MDLKHLSDEQLISNLNSLVNQEREILTVIIHHLREVERRRLFCGSSSLYMYAVEKLRYSGAQAQRRINAMHMLNYMPEMEEKIAAGELDLTHLNMVNAMKVDIEEKKTLLNRIANTSTREAEKILSLLHPGLKKEKDVVVDHELQEELNVLKGLLAHSHPRISNRELIKKLCELGRDKWDPARQQVKSRKAASAPNRRRVGRVVVRAVWQRANSQCEACGSKHALQIDHVKPWAVGGRSEMANLRLLCRNCNQRAAIEVYGMAKMATYLS